MKGKNDYQLFRERFPEEYSLTSILAAALLKAAGYTDGKDGKRYPAEGGFIYSLSYKGENPPVDSENGGGITIYCDPSFEIRQDTSGPFDPSFLETLSHPDEWLPEYYQGRFTFTPCKFFRLQAFEAEKILRACGVSGTKNPEGNDFLITFEVKVTEEARRAARLAREQEQFIALIDDVFSGSAYTYKYSDWGAGDGGYLFTFYENAGTVYPDMKAENAPERMRAALRKDKTLWGTWEVKDVEKTGTVGKINYAAFRVAHIER